VHDRVFRHICGHWSLPRIGRTVQNARLGVIFVMDAMVVAIPGDDEHVTVRADHILGIIDSLPPQRLKVFVIVP